MKDLMTIKDYLYEVPAIIAHLKKDDLNEEEKKEAIQSADEAIIKIESRLGI